MICFGKTNDVNATSLKLNLKTTPVHYGSSRHFSDAVFTILIEVQTFVGYGIITKIDKETNLLTDGLLFE